MRRVVDAHRTSGQLEMVLGPLYSVVVEEQISASLTGRAARADYRSPGQPLDHALRLAALLLDRSDAPEGDGPWRRAQPGGQRVVSLELVPDEPRG